MYDLLGDPTAIARRVDSFLQTDRFMWSLRWYDVSVRFVIGQPQLTPMNLTQQVTNRFLEPLIPMAIWGKYFKGKKMLGISEPDFLGQINSTMVCLPCAILCHTLRAWQTGVYRKTCDLRPKVVGCEPHPEPGIFSFQLGY